MRRVFDETHEKILARAQRRAEELTGDHFKLASFGPDRYAYEIATHREQNPAERAQDALAKLVRYVRHRPGPGHKRSPYNFFRICLQDPCILEAVDRSQGAFELEHLLLYVLTHELVHLIRFERFAHLFEIEQAQQFAEEVVVYRTTHEILKSVSDPKIKEILALYESAPPFLLDFGART